MPLVQELGAAKWTQSVQKDAGSPGAGDGSADQRLHDMAAKGLVVPEEIIITHMPPQVRLTNGESLHMAPQVQTGKICHWKNI